MKIIKPQNKYVILQITEKLIAGKVRSKLRPETILGSTQLWSLQWWSVRLLNIPSSAASGSRISTQVGMRPDGNNGTNISEKPVPALAKFKKH